MNSRQLTLSNNRRSVSIYPLIDEIVNELSETNLKTIIERSCETSMDKGVFMMFVTMYFHVFLHNTSLDKEEIKVILTETIRDPAKRRHCLQVFFGKLDEFVEGCTEPRSIGR